MVLEFEIFVRFSSILTLKPYKITKTCMVLKFLTVFELTIFLNISGITRQHEHHINSISRSAKAISRNDRKGGGT